MMEGMKNINKTEQINNQVMHYSIIERRCHGSELPSNLISCQGVQELFEFEVIQVVFLDRVQGAGNITLYEIN